MNIQDILTNLKSEIDEAILTSKVNGKEFAHGNDAKQALIRSKRLINFIHDVIKHSFISLNVNPNKIIPPLHHTKPEIKLKGFLKEKDQDICIVPNIAMINQLIAKKPLEISDIESVISINVRSQLSSLSKNIDTLYERTFAEAFNLHRVYPKQCLGEVYLIPSHEYDDKAMVTNKIAFKNPSPKKVESYINMFQAINNRHEVEGDEHKYERICLLIADFRHKEPVIYNDISDLIKANLVPAGTKATLERLTINDFAKDLLEMYSKRFDIKALY
jgi:hypothetical protein